MVIRLNRQSVYRRQEVADFMRVIKEAVETLLKKESPIPFGGIILVVT